MLLFCPPSTLFYARLGHKFSNRQGIRVEYMSLRRSSPGSIDISSPIEWPLVSVPCPVPLCWAVISLSIRSISPSRLTYIHTSLSPHDHPISMHPPSRWEENMGFLQTTLYRKLPSQNGGPVICTMPAISLPFAIPYRTYFSYLPLPGHSITLIVF